MRKSFDGVRQSLSLFSRRLQESRCSPRDPDLLRNGNRDRQDGNGHQRRRRETAVIDETDEKADELRIASIGVKEIAIARSKQAYAHHERHEELMRTGDYANSYAQSKVDEQRLR